MTTKTSPSRRCADVSANLDTALLEMAEDFRSTGLMSEDTFQKTAMRQGRASAGAPVMIGWPED